MVLEGRLRDSEYLRVRSGFDVGTERSRNNGTKDAGDRVIPCDNELAYVFEERRREQLRSECESTTIAFAACFATWTLELSAGLPRGAQLNEVTGIKVE